MHNGQESSLIRVNRITRGADIVRRERKLAEKNARDRGIYKGDEGKGGKDTRRVFLTLHRVTVSYSPTSSLLSSSTTSPHDYRPLSRRQPSYLQPSSPRDTFSTTTPLMKFLYYFNKRYLPLSDRYSSVAALCRGMATRFNSTCLRHFRENAPAYVSSWRI